MVSSSTISLLTTFPQAITKFGYASLSLLTNETNLLIYPFATSTQTNLGFKCCIRP